MITANEAYECVREGNTCEFKKEKFMDKIVVDACKLIVEHINHGWLCTNLKPIIKSHADRYLINKYLKPLGYRIYDDVVYWVFHMNDAH